MQERKLEELIETVFTEREQGKDDVETIVAHTFSGHAPDASAADFDELGKLGLVTVSAGRVALTGEGEARARAVVRRHRLAERLFRDLLDMEDEASEGHACEFEHILSAEATDSVCTLLGHPPTCPHGKAIPAGNCCKVFQKDIRPLVTRLPHLELGATARIVFIAPRFHDRMDRLSALGVTPGCDIRLHQRSPAYVLEVGESTIAIDPEIANEIYVKRRV
jgi:DtxR family Mn-dependent transcriptional regulator